MSKKFTQRLCLLCCWVFVTLLPQILPLFCIFIYLFLLFRFFFNFFYFLAQSTADPPGSFNSTITQRSTISARASAGWIRVTWTAPDCNQSENNECRTKSGTITLASLTFLSLLFFFFFFFALCLLLLQSPGKHKQTAEQRKKVSSKQSWLQKNKTEREEGLNRERHRVGQQGSTSLHSQGLANELITWGDSFQLT